MGKLRQKKISLVKKNKSSRSATYQSKISISSRSTTYKASRKIKRQNYKNNLYSQYIIKIHEIKCVKYDVKTIKYGT